MEYFPKGTRYSSLEKNILKYRAFEMVLILFRVDQLRAFVVDSIRATDGLRAGLKSVTPRLPKGTKNLYKRAWQILVDDEILASGESVEIQGLIDYRNVVAHATERLTIDVNRAWSSESLSDLRRYEPKALDRIEFLADKIVERMSSKYVLSLSL